MSTYTFKSVLNGGAKFKKDSDAYRTIKSTDFINTVQGVSGGIDSILIIVESGREIIRTLVDTVIVDRTATGGSTTTYNPGSNIDTTYDDLNPFFNTDYLAATLTTVFTTAAGLVALSTPDTSYRYYTTDAGKEGFWYYDSSDTTSTDNTGTILVSGTKRYKRIIEDNVNLKWFGASGDGVVNDTTAVNKALAYCNTNQKTLFVPAGTYKLSTWTVQSLTYVNILGEGKTKSTFIGLYDNPATKLIQLGTNSFCKIENCGFGGWNNVIYSTNKVLFLEINNNYFFDNRNHSIHLDDVDVYSTSQLVYGDLANNQIENTLGFWIRSSITGGLTISKNKFKNVLRNQTYYDVSTAYPVWAISVGTSNDVSPATTQDVTSNIIVDGNVIDTVYNASPASGYHPTAGIIVNGNTASITNNIVKNVSNLNLSGTVFDCSGIYTKVVYGDVSGNFVQDVASSNINNAAIQIKGRQSLVAGKPLGKNIKVHNNSIRNISGSGGNGIQIYGGSDIEIYKNAISGFTLYGIYYTGADDETSLAITNIFVADNFITSVGKRFINLSGYAVDNVQIERNICKDITGSTTPDDDYGISVGGSTGYVNNVLIKNNSIYISNLENTKSLSYTGFFVRGATTANNISIIDNIHYVAASTVTTANVVMCNIGKGSGNVTNVQLIGNTADGITAQRPFTLNSNTNLYSAAGFSSVTFKGNQQNSAPLLTYKTVSAIDANYTVADIDRFIILPNAITASRTVTLPTTAIQNEQIVLHNRCSSTSLTWSLATSVREGSGNTTTRIPNQSIVTLEWDGAGTWNIRSITYGNGQIGLFSKSSAPGTSDIYAGQAAIYKNTTDGRFALNFNDAGTIKQLIPTGSATITGDGSTTVFQITHSAGFTPAQVFITKTSTLSDYKITAKAATTFDITFDTAPTAGSKTFDWLVK